MTHLPVGEIDISPPKIHLQNGFTYSQQCTHNIWGEGEDIPLVIPTGDL